MSSSRPFAVLERKWDGPWYRIRTNSCEVSFLPGEGEDLDAVDNVDAYVRLPDGSKWSATIVTLAQVSLLMTQRWPASGESGEGACFWCPDGLLVRDPGVESMTRVIAGLLESGELTRILRRVAE
jgi:hypothetical protein